MGDSMVVGKPISHFLYRRSQPAEESPTFKVKY